ncbi:hypothetical protein [Christiangramia aquimixticola]|uniref:hypothetical protein n=1 Tax=Christiangramia aquimixticola TaxID=1697558 RepID=UPI003AA91AC2
MKFINIVAALIALYSFIDSMISTEQTFTLFSFELNIWLARIFWLVVFLGISYDLFKIYKKERSLKIYKPKSMLTAPTATLFLVLGVASIIIILKEASDFSNFLSEFPGLILPLVLIGLGAWFFLDKFKESRQK